MEVIARGAEAVIFREDGKVVKDRIEKRYRRPELDKKIREERTKTEGRLLQRALRVCAVPTGVKIEGTKLVMDYVDAPKLAEQLSADQCLELGKMVAKLHEDGITHGDLTTSNVLVGPVIIDFGLAKPTKRIEDFAIDIHLFKACLASRHPDQADECFKAFWKGYSNFKDFKEVDKRIEEIKKRGRYVVR